jgi:hypothetical protein
MSERNRDEKIASILSLENEGESSKEELKNDLKDILVRKDLEEERRHNYFMEALTARIEDYKKISRKKDLKKIE